MGLIGPFNVLEVTAWILKVGLGYSNCLAKKMFDKEDNERFKIFLPVSHALNIGRFDNIIVVQCVNLIEI